MTGDNVNHFIKLGKASLHETDANGHKGATIKLPELKVLPNPKDLKYRLTASNLAELKTDKAIAELNSQQMMYQ